MRLAYVDDSEQPSPLRRGLGPLLALGAAIVPENQIAGYASDLATIKTDLAIPPGEEIKWKPPKNSFLAGAGGELVSTLRQRMLEAAADRQIHTAVVIIDHGKQYTNRSKSEVGREILKWLYERISMHLGDHDDVGIVIADKPGGGSKEDSRWLADTLQLTNDGTEYVTPDRIVMPIVTAASHLFRTCNWLTWSWPRPPQPSPDIRTDSPLDRCSCNSPTRTRTASRAEPASSSGLTRR